MNTDRALERQKYRADPLADDTVAALIPAGAPQDTQGFSLATRLMATWTTNASLTHWQPEGPQADPQVVESLQRYLEQGRVLPEWV
ncbi:MAG: hypothetical protein R3E42_19140, partial [Burkholderiaceae bacterium]